eukprot:12490675-Alexandrium_andersonii.AAC.1
MLPRRVVGAGRRTVRPCETAAGAHRAPGRGLVLAWAAAGTVVETEPPPEGCIRAGPPTKLRLELQQALGAAASAAVEAELQQELQPKPPAARAAIEAELQLELV